MKEYRYKYKSGNPWSFVAALIVTGLGIVGLLASLALLAVANSVKETGAKPADWTWWMLIVSAIFLVGGFIAMVISHRHDIRKRYW